jgi:urea transport system permease protein
MRTGLPGLRSLGLYIASLLVAANAYALSDEAAKGMSIGDATSRMAAVGQAVVDADDATAAFLQALYDDAVKVAGDQVYVVRNGTTTDPRHGQSREDARHG